MQEGDAEVLLQARFNEAHGHPANAGAVFERIQTARGMRRHENTGNGIRKPSESENPSETRRFSDVMTVRS